MNAAATLSWLDAHGNWKHLFGFEPERTAMVEDAAASLARAIGITQMRIVDVDGTERYLNANGAFRVRAQ